MTERAAGRRLADQAREAEAVFAGDGEREANDRGVEMHVRVTVPVCRRKSESPEFLKLRADFFGERGCERGAEEVAQAGPGG